MSMLWGLQVLNGLMIFFFLCFYKMR